MFEDDAALIVITMIEEWKCRSPIILKVKCTAGWRSVSPEARVPSESTGATEAEGDAALPAYLCDAFNPGTC